MNPFTALKNSIRDRRARKEKRRELSFHAGSGAALGRGNHVRPESPGARVTGDGGSGGFDG